MKKSIIVTILLSLTTLSLPSFAHEGHDHDAPAMVEAPKGGQIKGLEACYVEVVSKAKSLKIYVYDKDLKPVDAKLYKITAQAELPRSKKTDKVDLKSVENYLEASYDAKSAHRYTLTLEVNDPAEKHGDKIKFTIEPKK